MEKNTENLRKTWGKSFPPDPENVEGGKWGYKVATGDRVHWLLFCSCKFIFKIYIMGQSKFVYFGNI